MSGSPKPRIASPSVVIANAEIFMEEALRCAQRALEIGEVPVGAIVVHEGEVVGRGWNRNLAENDPTAHAEIVALFVKPQTPEIWQAQREAIERNSESDE